MKTTNANVPIVARRPVLRWAVLIGGIAVGFATGLLTAKSFSFSSNEPKSAIAARSKSNRCGACFRNFRNRSISSH